MQKILEVPRLSQRLKNAEDVSIRLDEERIPYFYIDNVNWKDEFPCAPIVRARIAHTGSAIVLNYKVRELSARAVNGTDNGSVWEDSCVEFFFKRKGMQEYFNIEANCIGTILIASGPDRNNRKFLSSDKLQTIERYSSLGTDTFEEKSAPDEWELSLIIPAKIFGITSLRNQEFEGNFYKCGDMLSDPHFLSWNVIETSTPDFHRPEFFGKLIFKS